MIGERPTHTDELVLMMIGLLIGEQPTDTDELVLMMIGRLIDR